jgi:hypothetical protein
VRSSLRRIAENGRSIEKKQGPVKERKTKKREQGSGFDPSTGLRTLRFSKGLSNRSGSTLSMPVRKHGVAEGLTTGDIFDILYKQLSRIGASQG